MLFTHFGLPSIAPNEPRNTKELNNPYHKTIVGLTNEGKRKSNGPLEPNKLESSSSGQKLFRDQGLGNTRHSRGQKGNSRKTLPKVNAQDHKHRPAAAQPSSFLVPKSSNFSFGDQLPISNESFKFSSESSKTVSDQSRRQHLRDPIVCDSKDGIFQSDPSKKSVRSGMASEGAIAVGAQVGHPGRSGDQSSNMEKAIVAISNTTLMRIRTQNITDGEKGTTSQTDINSSDGECQYHEADSGGSP